MAIPPAAPDLFVALVDDDNASEAPNTITSPTAAEPELLRSCPKRLLSVSDDPDFEVARAYIEALMHWGGAPSVAVAVGHGGRIVWEEGFGLADKARRVRATPQTLYSLASISKPFTATGIMVLREQGKLRLEAPINDYLSAPGVVAGVGEASGATLERVASHTAGLPLHYRFFYDGHVPRYETVRRQHAILVTKPGERYHYSNLGYGLLEQVIAGVSGKSYANFMAEHVFAPLGLEHTQVGVPTSARGRTVAQRYDEQGRKISDYGSDHAGASAIYASAHDLVVFGMAQAGHPLPGREALLPRAAYERMRTPVAPAKTYALGWGVRDGGGFTIVSHTGGMPGVRTVLYVVPDLGVAVSVLVNASVGDAAPEIAKELLAAIGLQSGAEAICALPADHALLGTWAGDVRGPAGPMPITLEVSRDGVLRTSFGDASPHHFSQVEFSEGTLIGITFGSLDAEAAEGRSTPVRFDLQLRADRLTGSVTALTPGTAASTYFAELGRAE